MCVLGVDTFPVSDMLFRVTRLALKTSAYAVFVQRSKGTLLGLKGAVRCRALAAQWKKLPKTEKAKLQVIANRTTFKRRPVVRRARKAGPFALYVKKNYSKVASLPFSKRLQALAKQFKASQK